MNTRKWVWQALEAICLEGAYSNLYLQQNLRQVKESDRVATTAGNLRAMGAQVEEFDDGMVISGGQALQGCTLESYDDHRIAMSFLIAGLAAEGETTLLHCRNINTSYPGFEDHLRQLTR